MQHAFAPVELWRCGGVCVAVALRCGFLRRCRFALRLRWRCGCFAPLPLCTTAVLVPLVLCVAAVFVAAAFALRLVCAAV